jgi:hypothetical protein
MLQPIARGFMTGGALPLAAGGKSGTVRTPLTIPRLFRGRLTGSLFDTDKCFLPPAGLESIRAFRKIWAAHLGYPADTDLNFALHSFQRDAGVTPATVALDAATRASIASGHDA